MTRSKRDDFDWVAIERAWVGVPVGRRLTWAEKIHLVYYAVQREWSAQSLGKLLGMHCGEDRARAAQLARDVLSGAITVPRRNWAGEVIGA
jgi:hypothetical protein